MRVEQLGLSAFIAGTAIGYLIWYWARSGGEEPRLAETAIRREEAKPGDQPKPDEAGRPVQESARRGPRVDAGVILACAFFLIVLFIGMAFDASHPMGPQHRTAVNHWAILIAVLIVIALIVILLRASVRRRGITEPYSTTFKATLSVVFSFVLAIYVVILVWGPHSLYLSPVDRWIAAAPLGALLLGIVFGSVGAEWLNYIMSADRLKTDSMESQHRRWGFILLMLLFLGLIYPFFPQLLDKISSANVSTPLGGVAFSTQPISTIRQKEGQPIIGNETSETRNWSGFDQMKVMSVRDKNYADLFYRTRKKKLDALNRLHDGSDSQSHDGANDFAKDVLTPLGECVNKFFTKFHNRGSFQHRFNDAIVLYTKLLHPPKAAGRVDAKALLDRLAAAAEALNKDLRSQPELPESEEPCATAQASIARASPSLPINLPYAAMGLSFLLYDSGETEQAMREIASWVEDHYRRTAREKIEECNRKEDESCAYYGYKPDPGEGETAKWEQLPGWYRTRIEFELIEMLALATNRRVSYLTSHDLVHTIESLFSESEIVSAYDWAKCDSAISNAANRPKRGTSDEDLESRMAAAYFSLVDSMLRNLTYVAAEGLPDDDVAISPEMLEYGEKNSAVELHCLSYYRDRSADRETYEGEYKATYGVLLAQTILRREPLPTSDFERAGRKDAITTASNTLRHAIPILKQRVAVHDRELGQKRLDEKLFALPEERDYLRRATAALKSLEDLER